VRSLVLSTSDDLMRGSGARRGPPITAPIGAVGEGRRQSKDIPDQNISLPTLAEIGLTRKTPMNPTTFEAADAQPPCSRALSPLALQAVTDSSRYPAHVRADVVRASLRTIRRAGLKCERCDKPIPAERSSRKFCSDACRLKAFRERKRDGTAAAADIAERLAQLAEANQRRPWWRRLAG